MIINYLIKGCSHMVWYMVVGCVFSWAEGPSFVLSSVSVFVVKISSHEKSLLSVSRSWFIQPHWLLTGLSILWPLSLLSDPVAGGSSISTISMAVSMGEAKQGRYNRCFLCFAAWVFAVESICHLGEDSPYWWLFWEENWYFACIPFDFGPHKVAIKSQYCCLKVNFT